MSYDFGGTPEQMMVAILADLERARSDQPSADAYFRRALISLVGLHELQAKHGPLAPHRLQEFRAQLSEALLPFRAKIGAYAHVALILAEGANDDEWYELCMRRSVIQILLDDYAGTPLAALIDMTEVNDLDKELRRIGELQGPLPEQAILRSLPAGHWWWRYPEDET